MKLINELINDEKKINKLLYSSGPYWARKNSKSIYEIKRRGLKNFRGTDSAVGTSFSDNLVLDVRKEFNLKGRMAGMILSLPFLNTIFNSQLRVTKDHLEGFLNNQAILYQNSKNVLNLINKYTFNNTTDFGCVQYFTLLNKKYSCIYLNMADRIEKLSQFFNYEKINSFFEIGGGFGSNIHFLVSNFPNIKKILYLDTVPNIYVGTEYLKHHFGDHVKDYLQLKNLEKISFSNNEELEIFCIPPWLIERVSAEFDHFHNASSFVEMPEIVIENYVKYIKKFRTKEISLISYDGYDEKTTFDPKKLNEFFEKKLNISWINKLISQPNRKNIYLTSKPIKKSS